MELTHIKGFDGLGWEEFYRISPYGEVYSLKRNRLLKGALNSVGYPVVYLVGNYIKPKWYFIHRLVAATFLQAPESERLEIDHIDGNKTNNHYKNLQWVTHAENIRKSYERGRKVLRGEQHPLYGSKPTKATKAKQSAAKMGCKHPKFKGCYIVHGVRFESANQASKAFGIPTKTIINRANKGIEGYVFERA